jgi:hypothetical protein
MKWLFQKSHFNFRSRNELSGSGFFSIRVPQKSHFNVQGGPFPPGRYLFSAVLKSAAEC